MFKIIVDSSCDLDYDEGKSKGIMCQPIPYFLMYDEHLAQGEYRLQNTEKNRRIACAQVDNKELIRTHGLTPYNFGFLDSMHSDDTLYISLSGTMSGTHSNACTYARDVKNKNYVAFDSKTCSAGINILVDKALEFVDNHNVFEAAKELESLRDKIGTYFITTDSTNLNMSGRLTYELKSSGALQPCILGKVGDDGKLHVLQVLKSQDIAIFALVKLFSEQVEETDEHNVYISYANNEIAAKKLYQGISLVANKQAKITRLSPLCTAVGGTKTVVLAFVKRSTNA